MTFTTRPELRGTFGAVASTHWLAIAGRDGRARARRQRVRRGVRRGFRAAGRRAAPERAGRRPAGRVLVGRGAASRSSSARRASRPRPRRSTRTARAATSSCPGTGLLAACVPGSFGGWLLLLEQFGTWRARTTCSSSRSATPSAATRSFPGSPMTIERAEPLLRSGPRRPSSTCRRRGPGRRSGTRSSRRRGARSTSSRRLARGRVERRATCLLRRASSRRRSTGSRVRARRCS